MTKKFILRLCLSVAFVLTLHSCQQELLQTEQDYDTQLKQSTVERLSHEQLEKTHPLVLDKINQISPQKTSAAKKIYTDAENEFSIDTDEAYIVKDAKGTKTYTFKIERKAEKEEGSLENLILKDLGDGNLFGYFIKYDAYALKNNQEKPLSSEELGHHISLYAVGKKTSAEIFGKLDSCPMVFYTVGSYVYVDGQLCKEGLHSYGQPCAYLGTSGAATQGGYQVVYNITMQESGGGCGPGGFEPSSGSGSMGTTPVHGSGGGSINLSGLDDLCVQLESKSFDIADKITDLKGKVILKKETGYIEKTDGNFDYKDIAATNSNSNSLTLGDPTADMTGYLHTHVNDFEDSEGRMRIGFKIFSPADVIYFNQMVGLAQQNGIPLNSIYAVMVSANVNYQIRFTGNVNQIKTMYTNTKEQYNDMYMNYFQKYDDRSDELNFLKFIDEQMYVKGITLVKMNSNGTFTKKTLNADKTQVIDTDCP